MQSVLHPINGGWIQQNQALALVCQLSPETQVIFDAEQMHWELLLSDNDPLVEADHILYAETMSSVKNL
jgi:hypothetical protein